MPQDSSTPHPPTTAEFGHVVQGGPAHEYPANGPVRVRKLSVGPFDNDVYVLACDGQAIIVDGAAEPDRILAEVEGLTVTAIVQTHNHPDHTDALQELVRALGVPVLAHPNDPMPVPAEPLRGGERLAISSAELLVIHTPGHTPGSLCYLLDGDDDGGGDGDGVGSRRHLFTGDALFPGGPGNTNGDPARFEQAMRSLDELFALPDHTVVSPGHGLDTTLGRERPHLETWRARGW